MIKQDGIGSGPQSGPLVERVIFNGLIGVLAGAMALLAAGCGGNTNSNPLEGKNVGPLVAPHNEKAREQKVLENTYIIESEKDATFIEGETNSFKIHTRLFFDVDSYEIKVTTPTDDIGGFSAVRSPTEPGTWIVTWAPPKGFISPNKQDRAVNYRVELADVKSKDPQIEALYKSVNRVQDFSFRVRRTGKTPQITKLEVPEEVVQGSVAKFAVEVMDPASYEGFAPRVDIYFQGTNRTENNYEANGATYVRSESLPKHLGGGVWRFEFLFDAKNNDVGAQLDKNGGRLPGAKHLQTRFLVKAYSSSGGVSSESRQNTRIRYLKPQTEKPVDLESVPKCEPVKANAKAAKGKTP